MRSLKTVLKSFAGYAMLSAIVLAAVSCGKNDEPTVPPRQETPNNPNNPTTPEPQPEITVTVPSGTDNSVNFRQDADRIDIALSANFSASYELLVSGDHDWLYLDRTSGTVSESTSGKITLYANRRGLEPGIHDCTLIVSTEKVRKEIPVKIDIAEFVPFGSLRKVTSCDSRLAVTFAGFYKRDGHINLKYKITNNGDDIHGLKLWSHPNYTYFTDDVSRYDKDSGLWSILGNQSGTGDLTTSLRAGETIVCLHELPGGNGVPSGLMDAHLMIYTYGIGDWSCAGKYIDFTGLECEDLDNFNPDYRPTPPPAPEPDPQITIGESSLDFSTDLKKLALSLTTDRPVHYQIKTSETWLAVRQPEGDLSAGQQISLEFRVNRMNLTAGEYKAEITVSTPFQSIVVPVRMTVTEFVPYGQCGYITYCDARLPVTFNGCYKSGDDVTLMFFIRNTSGQNISGLKLWQHPNFTYFADNSGNRYTKDTGTYAKIGSASGTGDLTTRIAAGEAIHCTFTIRNVAHNASSFTTGVLRIYNYGTGDFPCNDKEIVFTNLTWTNLDTLFDF